MKRTSIIALLALAAVLTSCLREKSAQDIYNEQASGVALVLNQYYYTARFPDGSVIYFSGIDEDGDLLDVAFDRDSVTMSTAFGTAFFIDNSGTLLTNRHVVNPTISKTDVKAYAKKLIKALQAYTEGLQMAMAQRYSELQDEIDANTGVYYDEYRGFYTAESPENDELRSQQQELSDRYDEAQMYIDALSTIDVSELTLDVHCELGIAYHDTYVTKTEDFKSCVVVRQSGDEDVDLALIRLKDKTTPRGAHVFATPKDESAIFGPSRADRERLVIGQQLVLIGYNHGMQLASTREGIKAQLTTGNVSQQPDGDRVMYSIPMLQGSSGSPVVNLYGELVAVNFAGMLDTQSFNFGIPLNRINEFLKGH